MLIRREHDASDFIPPSIMPRATTKKLKSRGNTTKKNEHAAQATKASGPGSARRPPLRGRLQSFLDMPLDVINEVQYMSCTVLSCEFLFVFVQK